LIVASTIGSVTVGLVGACLRTVNFTPHVSPHFFFSSEDPQLRAEQRIATSFEQPSQIVLSAKGDIVSQAYQERVGALTDALAELPEAVSVLSLAHGPRDLGDALESPLWRRTLIHEDGRASNLILLVRMGADPLVPNPSERLVADVERIVAAFQQPDFQVVVSGVPYIIELMRRSLIRDLLVFSLATFLLFGTLMLLILRSIRLVLGMLSVCLSAGAVTLLATHGLRIPLGILTANLATIVFTLTLSHLVFMTFNWLHLRRHERRDAMADMAQAVRVTFVPSFWSMFTTLLGFASLLFVQAEPLRKLGASGSVGTLASFVVAYLLYPWVLWASRTIQLQPTGTHQVARLQDWFRLPHRRLAIGVVMGCLVVSTGIWRLRKDPDLLSYFARGSVLRNGLEFIDRNLGSSPLTIVVRDVQGARFSSTEMYQRLWDLQRRFEQEPAVGSVVSLPVIMAEARRAPLIGGLLPWDWLLELMESPLASRIGRYFVTDDRTQGLFLLLMKEGGRIGPRMKTVERLRATVRELGFDPHVVGGVYVLQGKLSHLVVSSLASGLLMLAVLFAAIAWWLARSRRIALAVVGSVALIPLWMLGVIGHLQVPFDVISAPAANLAVGMGVDSMIHLLNAARRAAGGQPPGWDAWAQARARLWQPILFSTMVVCAGFGVFGFSAFPPTQRFGLSIVLGTLLVPFSALFVLPWTAGFLPAYKPVTRKLPSR
jgi:predicted RND superfamily exporter protein